MHFQGISSLFPSIFLSFPSLSPLSRSSLSLPFTPSLPPSLPPPSLPPSLPLRMVSCGWDNVRLWRVKEGSLRSCPVNLEEHHQMHFTDVAFQAGYHNETDLTDRNM